MTNRIKEFRAKYNLTQAELAQKINIRRETIVFLEKNKYNPSLKLAPFLLENLAWSDIEFHSTKAKERYAQKQLGDINSEFNKPALELIKIISEKSGKECYYFLEKLRDAKNLKNELDRKCPICSSEWLLEEPLLDYYDFKCDKCKLLSRITPNVRWELKN